MPLSHLLPKWYNDGTSSRCWTPSAYSRDPYQLAAYQVCSQYSVPRTLWLRKQWQYVLYRSVDGLVDSVGILPPIEDLEISS